MTNTQTTNVGILKSIELAKTPLQLAEATFKAGWEIAVLHCVDAIQRIAGSEPATDGTWNKEELVQAIIEEIKSLDQ